MDTLRLRAIDRSLSFPALLTARTGSLLLRGRTPDPRPLIVRPGGMGDLILLCVAAERLGFDPREFYWVIERRSAVWARHLRLEYVCFDEGLVAQNWKLAGRFATVINSEQLFGLSQATALLACGRNSTLTCFDTNRAAAWADRQVPYDPDLTHETTAFEALLATGLNLARLPRGEAARPRASAATEKRIVGLAGLQSVTRAFSVGEWARFIHHWIGGEEFWIASSELDRPFARQLVARFPRQAQTFEGSFGELCGLVRNSPEVLTVDGGFLHIASYYGVPVTAIFTSSRATKWAPLAIGSRIVRRRDLDCQPCAWFAQVPQCPHHFLCKELDFGTHLGSIHPHPAPATHDRLLPLVRV